MSLFQWRNLKDLEANIQIKPRAWLQLKAEAHTFQLAERCDAWYLNQKAHRDPSGRSGDDVGEDSGSMLLAVHSCRQTHDRSNSA